MKAIFFGSGPVAAKSLELMLEWQEIACVITKNTPDHHKEPAPVEELAKEKYIKIYYADTKSDLDSLFRTGQPPICKIGIVIDYGVIISQYVIDSFELGIINSHFSLLPEWRGADPITFAILSGQPKTGVSIMLIDNGMDTGDILEQATLDIPPDYTTPDLTNALIMLSNSTLQKTIPLYIKNKCTPYTQQKISTKNQIKPTYSHKLTKSDGLLDPKKTAQQLERQVRAFAGWPNSRLKVNTLWLTVNKAIVSKQQVQPGQLKVVNKELLYGVKDGSLNIIELKPAGKKNMSASAFINGYAHILS